MNGKLIFFGIVVAGIAVWLWFGWSTANQESGNQNTETTIAPTLASSTPPVTYVASTTATEVTLDIQTDRSVATLQGLGYANLLLKATTTTTGTVYINTNELVRVIPQADQLRILVAGTQLFQGTRATSSVVE